MRNKTALIVWIGTGKYLSRLSTFRESMRYLPHTSMDYKLFTISDSEWKDDKMDFITYDKTSHLEICHTMWPIIALQKFELIKKAIEAQKVKPDYTFYFNSNVEFVKEIPKGTLFNNKLIAVHHWAWELKGKDPLQFTYGKPLDPKSECYIRGYYEYYQSGLLGGPTDMVIAMCDQCNQWLSKDLAHNRIPVFHDETAYNKYVHQNPTKFKVLSRGFWMDREAVNSMGYLDPFILLNSSEDTQSEYKDKFFES